jgi:hypothetical protein
MKRIRVQSEGVNRYKYRVLTLGIRTTNFDKNPVMLWNHDGRSIGTWKNLSKDANGDMWAEPVFDELTELSRTLKLQYEQGSVRAASIRFENPTLSDAAEHKLAGQKLKTVVACDLVEISLCAIPGNADAVYTLSDRNDAYCKLSIDKIKNPIMEKELICTAIGLPLDTEETVVMEQLALMRSNNDALQASRADALIAQGKLSGTITDSNEAHYRQLADSKYEVLQAIIAAAPVVDSPQPLKGSVTNQPINQTTKQPVRQLYGQLSSGAPTGPPPVVQEESFDFLQRNKPEVLANLRNYAAYEALALGYK